MLRVGCLAGVSPLEYASCILWLMKEKRIKLCFAIQSLDVGGSSQVVYDLVNRLKGDSRFEISLIVFFDRIDGRYSSLLRDPSVRVYILHKKCTIDIPFMFELRRTVAHIDPDIISSHLTCVFYLNLIVDYKRCKIVHTIHAKPKNDLPAIYRASISGNVKKRNIIIVACHHRLMGEAESIYRSSVRAIDNGIHLPSNDNHTAKTYDLLTVGRMDAVKRQSDFLKIIKSLHDIGIQVRGAIAGYGALQAELEREADAIGIRQYVDFFGKGQKTDELYERSKLFVLTSEREGSPIVILEANAFGIPVIATSVGGVPDMVHDGENGYTFEVGDIQGAAKTIANVLRDSKQLQRLSQGALAESKKHSDTTMANEYADLFVSLLPSAGSSH